MDDTQLWDFGMARLNALLSSLPVESSEVLADLLARYRAAKEDLAAVVAAVDAAAICCECQGQCCLNGKYRMNVCDGLACLAAQTLPVADFTRKPVCPYGTDAGCTMEPGLRPADCILFVCDGIDRKLTSRARLLCAEQEQILRETVHEATRLIGERLATPLLLWAEKESTSSQSRV